MKENIENALDVLTKLFKRLFFFAVLIFVISVISLLFIIIFNEDIAIKVFYINILIGLIPVSIVFLIITILIYGN